MNKLNFYSVKQNFRMKNEPMNEPINTFDERHQRYDEMVCCREGDMLSLFRHCRRVTCDVPIGPAHFRNETEAQERMSTGNGVYDCTGHHVLG